MTPAESPAPRAERSREAAPAEQLPARVESISRVLKLVGALAAALTPIVLPPRFVPEQLEAIRVAATLLTLLFVLLGWLYRDRLAAHLRAITVSALAAALLLLGLNLALVVTLQLGNPPEPQHFLVGFAQTDEGRTILEKAGVANENRERQLLEVGYDNIRRIYGTSYVASAVTYALATVATFGLTVLALTGAAQPAPTREGQSAVAT